MDIALRYDAESREFDLAIDAGDLVTDAGLETAVLLSLYTDRRAAPEDELPDGSDDRRGWWADTYANEPHGSKLWLLEREKATAEVRRRAEDYAKEALNWLIADGVARSVEVSAETRRDDILWLTIIITRPDGTTLERQFDVTWRAMEDAANGL